MSMSDRFTATQAVDAEPSAVTSMQQDASILIDRAERLGARLTARANALVGSVPTEVAAENRIVPKRGGLQGQLDQLAIVFNSLEQTLDRF